MRSSHSAAVVIALPLSAAAGVRRARWRPRAGCSAAPSRRAPARALRRDLALEPGEPGREARAAAVGELDDRRRRSRSGAATSRARSTLNSVDVRQQVDLGDQRRGRRARNITGYLAGLSSPSGTDSSVTLRCSPRSKLAGQTRLPTFSMNSTSRPASGSVVQRVVHHLRVEVAGVAGGDLHRRHAAGADARRRRSRWRGRPRSRRRAARRASARIVASSSEVLPAPGDDIRLSASTPCPSKCSRLCAATRSFSSRIAVMTSIDLDLGPGTAGCAANGARVRRGPE